ncbi:MULTISPECIES: aminotransferase class IV [Bremerella]|uniref:aminotransferase class IV n=1 Tax=Bremerella TaxID=2714594 RepID=UPI0031EA6CB3
MAEPIAYWEGTWKPHRELTIPLNDAGFQLGTTVAEQLRTFNGKIFRLDQHLDRLWRSLEILGVQSPESRESLTDVVHQIIEHNFPLLPAGADLGVSIFVTPGPLEQVSRPHKTGRLAVHTQMVAFKTFAHLYEAGQPLIVPSTRQTPVECWPRELKVRSRVHYYLADLEAKREDPTARAVLLDMDGYVMEATTANIAKYHPNTGLELPPAELVLPGISIATLTELAKRLDIPVTHRQLTPEDFATADEVLLTSTSPCVIPCNTWNGKPISVGKPGPIFKQLIEAWEEMVGLNVREQALRFAT